MALTLKATGLSTNLVICVGVDDNDAITEFVNGWTSGAGFTLGTGVAASVASSTWKGESRKYFETFANGQFDFHGVTFTTPPNADQTDADGMSVWLAAAGASAGSHATLNGPFVGMANSAGTLAGLRRSPSANTVYLFTGGGTKAVTTTSVPTDGTTKFSLGYTYRSNVSSAALYGLESGSLAEEDAEGSDGGFGQNADVYYLGGAPGQGNQPYKPFLACVFNRILTTVEMQSLHDDPWGELFEAPVVATGRANLLGKLVGGKVLLRA